MTPLAHPRGHQLAMPFLVLNLGIEMVYILEQRLRAQNIATDKCRKVMTDVLRAMLAPSFLAEVFRPQEPYTPDALKACFEKLAHASIMRLNESSMAKLYDLMSMAVKYQLLSAHTPLSAAVDISVGHLESLRSMLARGDDADHHHPPSSSTNNNMTTTTTTATLPAAGEVFSPISSAQGKGAKAAIAPGVLSSPSAPPTRPLPLLHTAASPPSAGSGGGGIAAGSSGEGGAAAAGGGGGGGGGGVGGSGEGEGTIGDLIDAMVRTIHAVYAHLPVGELWALHSTLCAFMQEKRVKVSLFLQEGLQCSDGALIIPPVCVPHPLHYSAVAAQSSAAGVTTSLPLGCVRYFDASGKQSGTMTSLAALVALHAPAGGEAAAIAAAAAAASAAPFSSPTSRGGAAPAGFSSPSARGIPPAAAAAAATPTFASPSRGVAAAVTPGVKPSSSTAAGGVGLVGSTAASAPTGVFVGMRLGANMYALSTRGGSVGSQLLMSPSIAARGGDGGEGGAGASSSAGGALAAGVGAGSPSSTAAPASHGRAGVNLLASLLGGGGGSASSTSFVPLFLDDWGDSSGGVVVGGGASSVAAAGGDTVMRGTQGKVHATAHLDHLFKGDVVVGSDGRSSSSSPLTVNGGGGVDDDLLAMMDKL